MFFHKQSQEVETGMEQLQPVKVCACYSETSTLPFRDRELLRYREVILGDGVGYCSVIIKSFLFQGHHLVKKTTIVL